MRPINLPQSVPTRVDYRTEHYWRTVDRVKPVVAPIVLSPPPGVVDVVDRVDCDAAMRMAARAESTGWSVMLSVSYFLDTPPVSGKHKGQWVEKRSAAVRLKRAGVSAYGIWIQADGRWSYDSGEELRAGVRRRLGAEDLEGVISGTPPEEIAERKRERARKRAEKKAAAVVRT